MKPILKCVITDDEPVARKGLKSYVEKTGALQLVGVCEDAMALNTLLHEKEVDLVFLDIEMPYLNGIEWLKATHNPPKVIFTTAYEQYALKGYELEVVDYLLKPISFERFLKAVNKAVARCIPTATPDDKHFFVKSEGRYVKLAWQDILYIESMENYVRIYQQSGKHIVHITLKAVMEQMPTDFIQIHKSMVVNMAAVSGVTGNMVEVGSAQLTIARGLKEHVMEKLVNSKLLKR